MPCIYFKKCHIDFYKEYSIAYLSCTILQYLNNCNLQKILFFSFYVSNCLIQSLQITAFLFTVCHVVIVIQDWFTDNSLYR